MPPATPPADPARPTFDLDAARRLLVARFVFDGTLAPLPGERDQNFHVRAAAGEYTLKIGNAAEPATAGSFVVTRTGGDTSTALDVYYNLGGTATAGTDYEAGTKQSTDVGIDLSLKVSFPDSLRAPRADLQKRSCTAELPPC